MSGVLLDSNVLIDYLRDIPGAVKYLESSPGVMSISAVTVAELHAGARDDRERQSLRDFLACFEVIPADGPICEAGGEIRAKYKSSHGVDLIDAIIAATSLRRQIPLVTLNRKHFPMLQNLVVPYHRRDKNE
jgi:predicted nucleic acid-binding protein